MIGRPLSLSARRSGIMFVTVDMGLSFIKFSPIHWHRNSGPGECPHPTAPDSPWPQESGTRFLVRTCVDRLGGEGGHTIAAAMRPIKLKVQGVLRLAVSITAYGPC